jgi:hypothetical protein
MLPCENVAELREGLMALKEAGYQFKSVTIDGRRGYYKNIKKILGPVPIQMRLFHQKATIRRYITERPKSICGQKLKELTSKLCTLEAQEFIDQFYLLKAKYKDFLNTKEENKSFRYQNLRAAYRSIATNLPYLFTHQDIKSSTIPTTINTSEGRFSHLKEKIKIHRGLLPKRKKKAISFLISKC